jgi:hypothetical protein
LYLHTNLLELPDCLFLIKMLAVRYACSAGRAYSNCLSLAALYSGLADRAASAAWEEGGSDMWKRPIVSTILVVMSASAARRGKTRAYIRSWYLAVSRIQR